MNHRRGVKAACESRSSDPRLCCVFEDDTQTGYLYVLDYTDGARQPIKDAVNIYNVEAANDIEQLIEFRWAPSGRRCGLVIDGVIHAFVDFDAKLASGRTNFPQVSLWTGEARAPWSDAFGEMLDS